MCGVLAVEGTETSHSVRSASLLGSHCECQVQLGVGLRLIAGCPNLSLEKRQLRLCVEVISELVGICYGHVDTLVVGIVPGDAEVLPHLFPQLLVVAEFVVRQFAVRVPTDSWCHTLTMRRFVAAGAEGDEIGGVVGAGLFDGYNVVDLQLIRAADPMAVYAAVHVLFEHLPADFVPIAGIVCAYHLCVLHVVVVSGAVAFPAQENHVREAV